MSGELVLVVDDEANILQLVRMYLEREGLRVATAESGPAALVSLKNLRPAVMILDIMLPGLDGLEILRRMRADKDPTLVLMLTARDEDIDKILGLEMGADDYLTKPFNPRELTARVKALLRRGRPADPDAAASGGLSEQPQALQVGDLSFDPASHEVRVQGSLVDLRHQEFNLLRVFLEHKGLVLSREQLLSLAWGYDYPGQTRTVDVHVGQLRKKLAASTVSIETVTSDGYKLVVK